MERLGVIVKYVLFFLVGGLLVYAVMSFTVVSTLKAENEELTEALDTSIYEAGRLLEAAKAQLESGNYSKAKSTLNTLFENQPGSEEAAEGRKLLVTVEDEEMAADKRWEAALPEIREEWFNNMAERLLTESDDEREELEKNMNKVISEEWEKAKSKIRKEWAN
jgi:predicted negative regulator of RcsB-dependent stress response